MLYNENKEFEVIARIAKIIEILDVEVEYIKENEETSKRRSMKLWFEEKKAIYEVKRILHEINYYKEYNEEESEQIVKGYLAQILAINE
ncbi:hypothetical protein [Enterococcus sp. AZ126]|uniref:hypothetical protein n=1 Tax=Enterococcus sp. AZ126 TaxID=2774635 RepID=UPI003F1F922F